jgi:hypothetical protein
MKMRGYEINKKTLIVNLALAGGVLVVVTPAAFFAYKAACGDLSYTTLSEFDARLLSCEYLKGVVSQYCPPGFPSDFDMCTAGFRDGFTLVSQGVRRFIPASLKDTVCNNVFGHNSTLQACYDSLDRQCWSAAWTGFSWAKSAVSAVSTVTSAVKSNCTSAAALTSGLLAGITLFTGLVATGANTILSCKKRGINSDEAVEADDSEAMQLYNTL